MAPSKVIIFGPTGAVGSAVARTAAELGAQVVLAMRDTSKAVPGLDAATEKQRSIERVQADLTKPDTVKAAVAKSGAKRAFFYLQFGTPDHMRATVQALKDGGIELPVFLSSFTVQGELDKVNPHDLISFSHAQAELSLTAVFGANNYVALRPGWFASNTQSWFAKDIASGEFKVIGPDAGLDGIAPEDIGRVGGTVLANGPQDDQRAIYLYGPRLMSHLEGVKTIAKELGIDPKIKVIDDSKEAERIWHEERGFPEALAKSVVSSMNTKINADAHVFGHPINREHLANIEKYSGKKPTTFEEWLQQHKQQLLGH